MVELISILVAVKENEATSLACHSANSMVSLITFDICYHRFGINY